MTGSSPANHENPPQSLFCLSLTGKRLPRGRLLLPFVKGGGDGFKKAIFNLIPRDQIPNKFVLVIWTWAFRIYLGFVIWNLGFRITSFLGMLHRKTIIQAFGHPMKG